MPERHPHRAAFSERLETAFGIRGILDRERYGKALRLMVIAGHRVGRHHHLAVDGDAGVHDLRLPVRRDRHIGGSVAIRHHRLDLRTQRLLIVLQRFLAISVVE